MRSMDPDYFKRLEQFIDDYMDEYGRSPTTREIAAGTGRALSTVHKYLSQMRTEGVLDYAGHRNITKKWLMNPFRYLGASFLCSIITYH